MNIIADAYSVYLFAIIFAVFYRLLVSFARALFS